MLSVIKIKITVITFV